MVGRSELLRLLICEPLDDLRKVGETGSGGSGVRKGWRIEEEFVRSGGGGGGARSCESWRAEVKYNGGSGVTGVGMEGAKRTQP
eukprot:762438-Hanusia_phi.AAC.1